MWLSLDRQKRFITVLVFLSSSSTRPSSSPARTTPSRAMIPFRRVTGSPLDKIARLKRSTSSRGSVLSPSEQLDIADTKEQALLISCGEAYCKKYHGTDCTICSHVDYNAILICGPHQPDVRLQGVLPPKKSQLVCPRCGASWPDLAFFAVAKHPELTFTKVGFFLLVCDTPYLTLAA